MQKDGAKKVYISSRLGEFLCYTGMWRGKVIKPDEGADCKWVTTGFTFALLSPSSVFGEEAVACGNGGSSTA